MEALYRIYLIKSGTDEKNLPSDDAYLKYYEFTEAEIEQLDFFFIKWKIYESQNLSFGPGDSEYLNIKKIKDLFLEITRICSKSQEMIPVLERFNAIIQEAIDSELGIYIDF